jgi:branched-chain amino acid transport system substrate-binding protein
VARIGTRWLLSAIALVVLALSLFAVFGYRSNEVRSTRVAGDDTTIKVGTVLPLTGNYAEYGQNVLPALQLASDELNQQAGKKISLVVEDDQAQPKQSVSALQKLIQVDGVRFVIGGFTSASSIAMYPVAERAGVLMFSPSSSTPALTANTPLFFRNWPSDAAQAQVFARETLERFKKPSCNILYSNSEYGVNANALFVAAYQALGGKIPVTESYQPNATDYRAQINKFLANPTDCVWLFGYYSEVGQFLKQARELGLKVQFFGQEGIEGQQLLDIAGKAADGLIYFVPAFNPDTPAAARFIAKYKEKTGHPPEIFAAHGYDALNILTGAIRKVGADPKKVAADLPTVKDYPGVAGTTSIDENGDAVKPVMTKTIRDGKFVVYQ